jgi:hypothetical protein
MFKRTVYFLSSSPSPYLAICFHSFAPTPPNYMAACCVICRKKKSDGGTVDRPWRNFELNQQANWPATQHLELQLYSKSEIRIFFIGNACFFRQNHKMGLNTAVNALK